MSDLSVQLGLGQKLSTSKRVVVDFDGGKTVNYEDSEIQSASFTWPTYEVAFSYPAELSASHPTGIETQTVRFGSTAAVPEITINERLMGYFAWSPDLTGVKIYQTQVSYIVKKSKTLVVSLYDTDHQADDTAVQAIIDKFNAPINEALQKYDLTLDQSDSLKTLLTVHKSYNIDTAGSYKQLKSEVLDYYNNYPSLIPDLVIFHISTDKILQYDGNAVEVITSADPITGEKISSTHHYQTKQWKINADNFKVAFYEMFCKLYGTGYCNKAAASAEKRYSGKRLFVLGNAPYSYYFCPGFDQLSNILGHAAWWVCYMPWKSMGTSMQNRNTDETFIQKLKTALCDPDGRFYGTYPSYSLVNAYVKNVGQTGSTSFPVEYPFFT